MNKRGLTLLEVLIAVFIIFLATTTMFTIYPQIFEGTNLSLQKMRAWEIAKRDIETLRNTAFATLLSVSYIPGQDPVKTNLFCVDGAIPASGCMCQSSIRSSGFCCNNIFNVAQLPCVTALANSRRVYYIEKVRDATGGVVTNLINLEVAVCFRVGRRVVGEDQNLNGVLDAGEDQNNDKKISSPITLRTLMLQPVQ